MQIIAHLCRLAFMLLSGKTPEYSHFYGLWKQEFSSEQLDGFLINLWSFLKPLAGTVACSGEKTVHDWQIFPHLKSVNYCRTCWFLILLAIICQVF